MQELFEKWWYGYLVVPIIITIFIGGLLSIWTGFFMARLVAFDQARMAAIAALSELVDLPDAQNFASLAMTKESICRHLLNVAGEFVRLRQAYAAAMMRYLAYRVGEYPWGNPPVDLYPLSEGNRQIFLARIEPFATNFSSMIFDLKPEFYSLITIRGRVRSNEALRSIATPVLQQAEEEAFLKRSDCSDRSNGFPR